VPEVAIFYGLYGSGKSEVSINYALSLSKKCHGVTIVDLDAVTPYFRVRDVREVLTQEGVRVLAPKDSASYADLPVLPEGIRRVLRDSEDHVVVDVGGDPTGARVLGGLRDSLPLDARVFFVVNFMRPFARTPEEAKEGLEKVSASSGVWPSGLVVNTHLGGLTQVSHVTRGFQLGVKLGQMTDLKVAFCGAPGWLREHSDEIQEVLGDVPVLWLRRFLVPPWEAH